MVSSSKLVSLHSFMVSVLCWEPFLAAWVGFFALCVCLAMLFLYRNLVSIGKSPHFNRSILKGILYSFYK